MTYSFFNLVVDPIKVSDTVQRFWKRQGGKLDDYFRNLNFHVEVYAYDMKTIAFLVRDKGREAIATSKATVREGDTYNATIGAEVAITSLLRKVINKDFRKISKEDAKIARKAYDQWLNSEKYNCGNPECKACNAATGNAIATDFGKIPPLTEKFVEKIEYTAGRSGRAVVSENGTVDILAKVETLFGDVSVYSTVSASSTMGDVESKILSALLGAIRNKKDFKIRTV